MGRYLAFALCTAAFAQQFDVATVKIAQPGSNVSMIAGMREGKFTARNSPLKQLLIYAYGTTQIKGPDWLDDARYDIEAQAPANTPPAQAPVLMRALLAERLGVKLHRESAEREVYALEVGRGGAKVFPYDPNKKPEFPPGAAMLLLNGDMAKWSNVLGQIVDRPVVNRTGLEGTYYHMLAYGRDESSPQPGVFTSLQEQTGLRLTTSKAEVEIIVVDSAVRTPTDN